jgi:hypothetical protein
MLPSEVPGVSRVELEPVMCRADQLGQAELVAAIVAELGARVWLAHNPYAPPDAQNRP